MNDTKRCQWCGCPLVQGKTKWCSADCSKNGNTENEKYRKAVASPAGRIEYYKTSLRIIKKRIPMRLTASLTSCQWKHLIDLYDTFEGGTEEEVKLNDLIGEILDAPGKEPLSKKLRNDIKRLVHNNQIGVIPMKVKVAIEPWKSDLFLVVDPDMECTRKGFRAVVEVKAEKETTYYQLDYRCTPDAGPEVGIWETDKFGMSEMGTTEVFPYPCDEGISKEGLLKFIEEFNWLHFIQQVERNAEGEKDENVQELQ